MTKEQIDAIPRKEARQLLASIPGGPGHDDRVLLAVEQVMNLEWWRGYYANDGLRPAWRNCLSTKCGPAGKCQSPHRCVGWDGGAQPPDKRRTVCQTCFGIGLIGGFVTPESGYQDEPCPDCKREGAIPDEMVDRALNAWFASPPSESDVGLERSMRAALVAALSNQVMSGGIPSGKTEGELDG